ncbi:MAG: hypothetical protein JNJ73_14080 [Hyphomonadaceae bacterium]|nr:hypothetical protein [Hyphomonadaceae bacterium]
MTKLDRVIERLRALPEDEQDRLAAEIQFLIDDADEPVSLLTSEQEAELLARLSAPDDYATDEEVEAFFRRLDK